MTNILPYMRVSVASRVIVVTRSEYNTGLEINYSCSDEYSVSNILLWLTPSL
jgi:hypothetical protein